MILPANSESSFPMNCCNIFFDQSKKNGSCVGGPWGKVVTNVWGNRDSGNFFAIGNDCRVLTRKKSDQRSQGLAYDFKDTTRTTFLQGWWSRWLKSSSMRIGTGGGQDVPGSVAERFRVRSTAHSQRSHLQVRWYRKSMLL